MKLLIIEDNPRLSKRMKQQLQKWYVIEVAQTGDEGLRLASTDIFDLIMLDLGLPDTPGLVVCQQIRAVSRDTPILVVTGIDTTASRVELLEAGADDYITKPFDPLELTARINALMRRRKRGENIALITIGDLEINPARRTVNRAGIPITLRKKEFDILEYLASHAGSVVPRHMIINHAWPVTSKGWVGSIDVHIKQLRDKVDKPFSYPIIKTSYGIGYMVDIPNGIESVSEETKV